MANFTNRYRKATKVVEGDTTWISPNTTFVDTTPRYDDIYHVVQQGDRLDSIAQTYLGDHRLWWVVAEYNERFWILDIEHGDTLRVPSYDHAYLDLLR